MTQPPARPSTATDATKTPKELTTSSIAHPTTWKPIGKPTRPMLSQPTVVLTSRLALNAIASAMSGVRITTTQACLLVKLISATSNAARAMPPPTHRSQPPTLTQLHVQLSSAWAAHSATTTMILCHQSEVLLMLTLMSASLNSVTGALTATTTTLLVVSWRVPSTQGKSATETTAKVILGSAD